MTGIGAIETEGDLRNFVRRQLGDVDVKVRQLQGAAVGWTPVWTPLVLSGDWSIWSAAQAPAYAIAPNGLVFARGWARKATAWGAGSRIARLPAGARPGIYDAYFDAISKTRVDVGSDGWIATQEATWASTSSAVSLACVQFWAEG